jgi:IMP dehydrogenase
MYFGYSDIQLRTEQISEVESHEVSTESRVTTNYSLRNPILGAAMNSVSEDDMAIAMAKVGGGAFVHHANTPDEQYAMVRNVKHHLNGIIRDPVLASQDATIEETARMLDEKKNDFRTLPVIDTETGRCVGLMKDECFKLFDPRTLVRDAMHGFDSMVTAINGTTPQDAFQIMRDQKTEVLTLLDKERKIGGLCLVDDILREVDSNPEEFSLDSDGRLITFASVPTIPEEAIERVKMMYKYINVVGVDTSHGEHKHALDTLRILKEEFDGSHIDIVAGNISTEQTAEQVARLEPDAIVVGQGPGQICVSSDRLGFGTPQASAVYEVSEGAHSVNPDIPIIADGGIKDAADTVKAYALGAAAVKVGGLIAGTDEAPVPVLRDENNVSYKEYWGMGSERAQRAFAAARARYGHYGALRRIFIEGFEKRVPLKGPVSEVIEEHRLGIGISMAALGARNIPELQEIASFGRGRN